MIVFEIHLRPTDGDERLLVSVLTDEFVPAVRRQPGFLGAEILRAYADQPGNPPELVTSGFRYQVILRFEAEAHRRAWAASEDHQAVFPKVRSLAEEIHGAGYEVVAGTAEAEG